MAIAAPLPIDSLTRLRRAGDPERIRRLLKSAILGLILVSVAPGTVSAQFGTWAGLADAFSDVGFQWGWFFPLHGDVNPARKPKDQWLGAYGVEFLFELARNPRRGWFKEAKCVTVAGKPTERRVSRRPIPDTLRANSDTTSPPTEVIEVFSMKRHCPDATHFIVVEIGVGYGQTTRFAIRDGAGLISGIVREAPSINVYATRMLANSCEREWLARAVLCASPYAGVRTGVIELVDPALAIDPVRYTDNAPRSLQIGGVVGISPGISLLGIMSLFLEASYVYRAFPTISWTGPNSSRPTVPTRTALDLSGLTIAVGGQFQVREPKK